MANNRMYLRCKGCGENIMLAKCFGWSYQLSEIPSLRQKVVSINEFLDKHCGCDYKGSYDNIFELEYEFNNESEELKETIKKVRGD